MLLTRAARATAAHIVGGSVVCVCIMFEDPPALLYACKDGLCPSALLLTRTHTHTHTHTNTHTKDETPAVH
jgi:hypothetical protein